MQDRVVIFFIQIDGALLYREITMQSSPVYYSVYLSDFLSILRIRKQFGLFHLQTIEQLGFEYFANSSISVAMANNSLKNMNLIEVYFGTIL